MQISQILDKVNSGDIALPEFQRGYVWTRDQVRGFFQSLYRGYPIGGFLTWSTKATNADARGNAAEKDGTIHLLLDGQQRVTTLFGVTRGTPPQFFEGNPETLSGLHFNLDTEAFEFYAPAKMKDNPTWVNVTALFQQGIGAHLVTVTTLAEGDTVLQATYFERLNRITQIKDRLVHIEDVTGPDMTIDVVVEIFNRVNSGGTKLSKGDLALAAVCASWPSARVTMKGALADWSDAGFNFKLDWLLRNTTAVVTGGAEFSRLGDVAMTEFKDGLQETVAAISYLLNSLGGRLGLDHDRVVNGRGAFPVMSRLLHHHRGTFPDSMTRDRLFYWYIHSFLWGRYTGATETALNQDLQALDEGGVDALIAVLQRSRGHLDIRPDDFIASSIGSRFYPLLYLLTRVHGAQDLLSGVPLKDTLLGRNSSLQVHHIFPKARLREYGYSKEEVNAVANLCFLTQDSNLKIGAKPPAIYLEEIAERMPETLSSQWIPADRLLWRPENYGYFLEERRRLLANAANSFLRVLHDGPYPVTLTEASGLPLRSATNVADHEETSEEVPGLSSLLALLANVGMAQPEHEAEVCDPRTGKAITIAAAFWPQGLQGETGTPVLLSPETTPAELKALESCGYRVFHSSESLGRYVSRLRAEQRAN
ncbi:GmrSD restriction endonuclease domain-containing protein [Streptomyces yaizuensis]|uniref:DUF262 domain-containing protein n=1 Tax=Streptomyces yaizuensis TaxID=2989713 RepID=A0ABQ5NRN0_9ACTN|nr:DUF262 domain-containing protein [Streptomyces sp. YSPA8]GLF92829.1 DUF262 domain-containing protein [Streptomyces sp. YSPA8]